MKKKPAKKRKVRGRPKKTDFETIKYRFVRNKLRTASQRWAPKDEAFIEAKVSRGNYQCAECKEIFKRPELQADHVEPVVPVEGQTLREDGRIDWNYYIDRLFVPVEGYQILCKTCHDIKTEVEDNMRVHYRQEKKKEE